MRYSFRNLKSGLISLGLVVSVFFGILLLLFIAQSSDLKSKIESSVVSDIKSYTIDIDNKIAGVASDVILLEELIKNNDVFNIVDGDLVYTSVSAQDDLTKDIYDWINVNTDYDQIRILDTNGMEMIRVNYNEGNPVVVDTVDLQDKGDRYYFTNAIDLADDYIYLSKLDLNVENGMIEYVGEKPKAMLRIASTIYNDDGEQIGLLIVNYLANKLFHDEETKTGEFTAFEVINQDGYFLHSFHDEKEFGFMFPEQLDETFEKYHDYDIFETESQNVIQQIFKGELYTSVVIGNVKMSSAISEVIRENIPIYSDNGDIIIFGEVDIKETAEYKNLLTTYTIFASIAVVVSIVLTRLVDELTHSRKQEILSLEYASKHDVLTGLPNRAKVFEFIQELSIKKTNYTLMFLDFDGFKKVNDRFGHDIGDLVLIEGANRIKGSIRETDIISRIGGDEFIVVLTNLIDNKAVSRILNKIQTVIGEPFIFDNVTCNIGVSIGFAIQDGSLSTDEIVKVADTKMYENKNSAKI